MLWTRIARAVVALTWASMLLIGTAPSSVAADSLPSWNDGRGKQAIIDFVGRVTKDGGADFVPEMRRVAVFDNDGTLWAEQPVYFQLAFAFDEIKSMSAAHPEWLDKQPFKAVLKNDQNTLAEAGSMICSKL